MSFLKILIAILLLVLINLTLDRVIKVLEKNNDNKVYNKNSNKLSFNILAKRYIETLGVNVLFQGDIEDISINQDKNLILICCKDLSKEEERIKKRVIMSFISKVYLRKASKGIVIYNGDIPRDIEDTIQQNKSLNLNIEFINKKKILSNINSSVLKN